MQTAQLGQPVLTVHDVKIPTAPNQPLAAPLTPEIVDHIPVRDPEAKAQTVASTAPAVATASSPIDKVLQEASSFVHAQHAKPADQAAQPQPGLPTKPIAQTALIISLGLILCLAVIFLFGRSTNY